MTITLISILVSLLAGGTWLVNDLIRRHNDMVKALMIRYTDQQIRHMEHTKEMQGYIQSMTETYIRATGGTYIPPVRSTVGEGKPTEKWGDTKHAPIITKGSIIR